VLAPGRSQWLLRVTVGLAVILSALGATARASASGWTPIHDYTGVVPVLLYHGIHPNTNPSRDPYSVSGGEFARQIQMLSESGFHTISIAQYARFARGDVTGLPDRPILITFDDSRVDSFQGADLALARAGMRATMFVITANASAAKPGYLTWPQLAGVAATGRWDLQEHAHAGHVLIPTGPRGQTGPYYANLLYQNGVRETFTAFKRRVTNDILTGRRLLASSIPGFEPLAFALPYSSYGQSRTNYAPIPAWESYWLRQTFKTFFVQDRRIYNLPGNPIGQRYGIRASTTAPLLRQWLEQALPKSAWITPPPPPPAVVPRSRPKRPSIRRLRVGRRSIVIVFRIRAGAALKVSRRRVGHRRSVPLTVSARGRLRDRRLRPGAPYVYRAVAISAAGPHSKALVRRIRTRR
jgi:peptidoglycan/xylan/chitin deacetylase (PgdA/CDA1 family)